jgi:hypothetical protein
MITIARKKPRASKPKISPAPRADVPAPAPVVTESEIRVRAYGRWASAGKPPGDGVPFWLEAEQELWKWKTR